MFSTTQEKHKSILSFFIFDFLNPSQFFPWIEDLVRPRKTMKIILKKKSSGDRKNKRKNIIQLLIFKKFPLSFVSSP